MKKYSIIIPLLFALHSWAQTPNFAISGFATFGDGTTGGAGGKVVTVSTYADLKKYAEEADTKYIIQISGTITGTGTVAAQNYQGSIAVKSNKTILGLGTNAFLDGVGLNIKGVKNIIVQNIKFSFISIGKAIPAGSGHIPSIYDMDGDEGRPQILVNSGDLISISGSNSNIWIDHCEFYEEDPKTQTNIDLYDGLIDIKDDSRYITISWCYFHDHHKCTLMGSSDTNLFAERKVTFHHNYYIRVGSRLPLIRGGIGHFFNNYVNGASSASNSRMGSCVKSEKNYFENSKAAVTSSDNKGFAEVVDNHLVNSTTSAIPVCKADIPYNYSAVLTSDPTKVKNIVVAYAGVGKLVAGFEDSELNQDSQLAFPNPFTNQLSVQQKGSFSYQIFTLEGKEIESGTGTNQLEIGTNLAPNLYLLRVKGSEGIKMLKISKME